MDSISSRARMAFRWTLSLRLLSQLFTWLSSLLVIRLLTPADYGIVAIAEMVLMLALQLATAGLGDALIRQEKLNDTFIRKILTWLIVLNAGLAILQLSLARTIADFYSMPQVEWVLYATSLAFLLTPWIVISSNLLAREMNFKSRSKIDFAATLAGSVLALVLAITGFGFWSLVLSNLAVIFLRAIGYTLCLKRFYLPILQLSGTADALKFGTTLMATGVLFTLFMKADIMIAARFIDSAELGFYAVAIHLALLPMVKAMPLVNEVAYPMYAAIKQNKAEYDRMFCYILRIITLFSFPLFYGFAATADQLVPLILGERWQAAIIPLQLVLLTIPFRIVTNLFTPLMKALGYPSTGLIHVSFSLGLTVILVLLTAQHGINALAASWLAGTPLFFLFAVYLCTSRSGISNRSIFSAVAPPLLLSSVMLAVLHWFKLALPEELPVIAALLLTIVCGALVYVIGLKVLFPQRFTEALKFRL